MTWLYKLLQPHLWIQLFLFLFHKPTACTVNASTNGVRKISSTIEAERIWKTLLSQSFRRCPKVPSSSLKTHVAVSVFPHLWGFLTRLQQLRWSISCLCLSRSLWCTASRPCTHSFTLPRQSRQKFSESPRLTVAHQWPGWRSNKEVSIFLHLCLPFSPLPKLINHLSHLSLLHSAPLLEVVYLTRGC